MEQAKGKWELKKITATIYRIFSNVPETKKAIEHTRWICNVWDEEDAQRIVTAVNSHDGLVEALTAVYKIYCRICTRDDSYSVKDIANAHKLAKAALASIQKGE